ncbi:MAG TPA: TetR/AcrR family transcriptional regulator [Enteractinococcus sp.]
MSKTPASPLRLPRDQRRAQLIDVALDVFAERGYAQTTMDDVAQRAAVSKPVLYQHFTNKRELYFTLIDSQLADLRDRVTTAMQTVDPSSPTADEEVAYQAVHGVFEFTADPRGHYRLLQDTSMDSPEELEERLEHFLSELVEFISPYILDNSILDPVSSKFITRGIASSVLFLATRWAEEYRGAKPSHPNIPLETAVAHTCRFVAYGAIGFDLSNNPTA